MNKTAPFQPEDLAELDAKVLSQADAVVAMREVVAGNTGPGVIQMRHDVDNASAAWDTAVKIAEWEAQRGYRSTFFLLHTARYWFNDAHDPDFARRVRYIAQLGHEVGLHLDALGHVEAHGGDPWEIVEEALFQLRALGIPVRGTVGHGNRTLPQGVTNDSLWTEMQQERGNEGLLARRYHTRPRPLADFGLDYEAVLVPRGFQMTDSGGQWVGDWSKMAGWFRSREKGQMHFNMHPDWWGEAL